MNAPVQTLQASKTDTTSSASAGRFAGPARRHRLLRVVATTPRAWLAAAGATAAVALVSTADDRVPIGSGVAVAVLTIAAVIDVRERRLPDVIVASAAVALTVCIAIDVALWKADPPIANLAGGIAVFAGPLLVLHLIAPAAMGFGDVKAAVVLGAAVGIVDWRLALAALALAAGCTATVGVISHSSTLAFGPGLVAASAIVLTAHPVFLVEAPGPETSQLHVDRSGAIELHDEVNSR